MNIIDLITYLFIAVSVMFYTAMAFVCLPLGVGATVWAAICRFRRENFVNSTLNLPFKPALALWAFGASILFCFTLYCFVSINILHGLSAYFAFEYCD